MINTLILSGNQIRGLGYVGVLKALEELNIKKNIKNICGISSGSIFALAYCLRFSYNDLRTFVFKINIDDLKEGYYENIFNLIDKYGLDSGHKFERLIKLLLKKKIGNENCTFLDLNKFNSDNNLIIVGSNLTTMKTEYFSMDTTPDMEIWKAIRISISFPIIFEKFVLNQQIYIDGGVTDNYPIEHFLDDLENTIGICIHSSNELPIINSLHTYLLRIIYILASQKERVYCKKYADNTIIINVNMNIASIDFSNELKQNLIDEGYNQFITKIKEKDIYKRYVNNITKELMDDIIDIIDILQC
tara:strand:- start:4361 stop:5269 length:909 start_codon:yes stop_codon:yes gene_type:complete